MCRPSITVEGRKNKEKIKDKKSQRRRRLQKKKINVANWPRGFITRGYLFFVNSLPCCH
jgi:hypothetical protein